MNDGPRSLASILAVPSPFVVRPATRDDAADIAALINERVRPVVGSDYTTPDEIRGFLDDPRIDLERDTALIARADGAASAWASFESQRHRETGLPEVWFEGWVSPHARGGGLGSAIVDAAEARGRHLITSEGAGACIVASWAFGGDADAQRFLRSREFEDAWRAVLMTIDLDDRLQTPRWPAGISVRTLVGGVDDRAAHASHTEAFADTRLSEHLDLEAWVYDRLHRDGPVEPGLQFLAVEGDDVVGGALCRTTYRGEAGNGYITDLWVRGAWRRRGLGEALLRHCFLELRAHGCTRATLGVEQDSRTGADRLYARAGMRMRRDSVRFEKRVFVNP